MWIWSCHFDASWWFCPLVDAVSTLFWWSLPFGPFLEWLVLVVPFMFSASFRSSCKAGLVVMKSLSNCLFIKCFISPSIWNSRWKVLFFQDVEYWPHSLLACTVSAKRSAVSLMGFPLCVTRSFSLAALSIFSCISTLVNVTIMCLGVALLEEYLCSILCISYTWMVACLARLGKFSWIISWRVFPSLDSFSPSHSGTPIKHTLGLFR